MITKRNNQKKKKKLIENFLIEMYLYCIFCIKLRRHDLISIENIIGNKGIIEFPFLYVVVSHETF